MWLLADCALGIIIVFHLLVMWSAVTPVDSPLKKPLLGAMCKIASVLDRAWIKLSGIGFMLAVCVASARSGAWDDANQRTRFCASFITLLSTPLYMKLTHIILVAGAERVLELEETAAQADMMKWEPPSLAAADMIMAPIHSLLQTEVVGLDRVPADYPCFYVMNHSLMGIEMPSFIHLLYKEKGIFVRGLADHFHWMGPHGPFLRALGAVDGNRSNVDLLMANCQNVLVYPGGGAEILKSSKVERYTLMWKNRLGFARMAIKNKYPILPCASVGSEDMLDIMLDIPMSVIKSVPSIPLVKPNSLQKIYFWFGEPIPTEQYGGDSENDEFANEVRDKTKAAIETGIKELQEKQSNDPDRYFIDRVGKQIREVQAKAEETFKSLLEGIKTE